MGGCGWRLLFDEIGVLSCEGGRTCCNVFSAACAVGFGYGLAFRGGL